MNVHIVAKFQKTEGWRIKSAAQQHSKTAKELTWAYQKLLVKKLLEI